ncbi:MAG: peroxiredoxin [Gammaproteobacteria bacterium]|nr:peroxiredoxin [Gammaproteobacteria bacterium]
MEDVMTIQVGDTVPEVEFQFREGDSRPDKGTCPVGGEFVTRSSKELFSNKRVIVFSLPGAFTPTCSTYQLPGFDEKFSVFKEKGIDDIFVISVNDAFVMNAWAIDCNIKNIKTIPDGNAEFTVAMGMNVAKNNLGFGQRSWRYAAIINDGVVEKIFEEPGKSDNFGEDPYGETSPENVLSYLEG